MYGNNLIVEQDYCEYRLHEIVFVKMTGYSVWWPSRIIRIEANRYQVYFLGDLGRM